MNNNQWQRKNRKVLVSSKVCFVFESNVSVEESTSVESMTRVVSCIAPQHAHQVGCRQSRNRRRR